MKKQLYLLVALASAMFFAGCDKDDEEKTISKIEIVEGVENQTGDGKTLQMKVGQKIQLHAQHFPERLDQPTYSWKSSNTNVVQAGYGGYVTAINTGTATVTVTTELGVETKCVITVGLTAVKEINLETDNKLKLIEDPDGEDYYQLNMIIGGTYTFNPITTPDSASYKYNLVYVTVDEGFAYSSDAFIKLFKEGQRLTENGILQIRGENLDVTTSGTITPKQVGTTDVIVVSPDSLYAHKRIHVSISPILEKDIVLSDSVITMEKGETKEIVATVKPDITTFKELSVDNISGNGTDNIINCQVTESDRIRIVALEEGEATFDVSVCSGMTNGVNYGKQVTNVFRKCRVKVLPISVKGLTLDKGSIDMVNGTTAKLNATISPYNAKNQNIDWSSRNPNVVTISTDPNNPGTCTISAIAKGTAYVTATSQDGNHYQQCLVNVGLLTDFLSSESTGISTVFSSNTGMNNKLSFNIINNSNVDIQLTYCEIINSVTGNTIAGCSSFSDPIVRANSTVDYTLSGRWLNIEDNAKPIVKSTILYDGTYYEIRSSYSSDYELRKLGMIK
ncbi:MAG: Ig domain-containing protein [Bacteroidales bacterium]|nr:Ig domain-containing protein [Bacteroidales bacterium]